jgi:hypothetical protein
MASGNHAQGLAHAKRIAFRHDRDAPVRNWRGETSRPKAMAPMSCCSAASMKPVPMPDELAAKRTVWRAGLRRCVAMAGQGNG